MSKTTLYKQTRTGKIQEWTIWAEEKGDSGHPEVWIEHGLTDGKKQLTNDIIKEGVNIGKANETSPFEQAKLTVERKATKQKEEGYKDTIEEAQKRQSINFTERFPKELCFYKPKNSIDEKKIAKLEAKKQLMITVKEDGQMYVVRKTKQLGVEIYSRRMELETDKFPHLVEELKLLPDGIVLLGEIILDNNKPHMVAFKEASSICRSETDEALRKQEELGKVSYRIFDLAFFQERCMLTTKKFKERLAAVEVLIGGHPFKYVGTVRKLFVPHAEAMEYVKENKREGLVLWDKDGIMEDGAAYTFNGKAYRPNMLWKSKPKYEDDFIVRWDPSSGIGEYGKGKNNGKVKSVSVYQLDDGGKEIYLGNCGGGLSDEQRDFYTTADYPRVWKIEYDAIQPGTGSLRYPVFNDDRTLVGDKELKECLLSEAIKLARLEEEDQDEEDEN